MATIATYDSLKNPGIFERMGRNENSCKSIEMARYLEGMSYKMECKIFQQIHRICQVKWRSSRNMGRNFHIELCENQVHLFMLDAGKCLGDRSVVA